MQWKDYNERVVIALCGLYPQIITELIYALVKLQSEPFIPTRLLILTTKPGAQSIERLLLSKKDGKLYQLIDQYQLNYLLYNIQVEIFKDAQDKELEDINSDINSEAVADRIINILNEETSNPQAALHVSIAGGRKTMGYYLGYGLSLFGRKQDRLSHILVPSELENDKSFFYPSDNNHSNANKIQLVDIPFIRLASRLPKKIQNQHFSFSEEIRRFNLSLSQAELIIDTSTQKYRIQASGILIETKNRISLLFYCWLAQLKKSNQLPISLGHDNIEYVCIEFLKYYCDCHNEYSTNTVTVDSLTLSDNDRKNEQRLYDWLESRQELFQNHLSKAKKALVKALGADIEPLYQITSNRIGNIQYLDLSIAAENIHFKRIY